MSYRVIVIDNFKREAKPLIKREIQEMMEELTKNIQTY